MIKTFEAYIYDENDWIECPPDHKFVIGERVRVRMNPNSIYTHQTKIGLGTIKRVSDDNSIFNVRWDDTGEGFYCWRGDLLINVNVGKGVSRTRWYKKGKLITDE